MELVVKIVYYVIIMKNKNITIKKGAQVMNNNKNVKYSSHYNEILKGVK